MGVVEITVNISLHSSTISDSDLHLKMEELVDQVERSVDTIRHQDDGIHYVDWDEPRCYDLQISTVSKEI